MAKESTNGKIQFVFVNVEGDQSTLQEALKQVGNALNKGMSQQPKYIVQQAPISTKQLGGNNQPEQPIFEAMLVEDEEESQEEETTTTVSSKPKRQRRAPKAPPLLKEEDLASADVTFMDYTNRLDVSSQYNKYLAIASWFDTYLGIKEISASHIYTCYHLMKWPAPDNLSLTFQNAKRNNKYFENGSKNGLWAITLIGKNEVARLAKNDEE